METVLPLLRNASRNAVHSELLIKDLLPGVDKSIDMSEPENTYT